ncbi:uncharacterized protein DS421_3g79820 [Arachis hypogaea]|nr:uncharacterized protein DS421_3g79820 [Arachis hypogaea]
MDVFTIDLFACLLPVLSRLLDGKPERHVKLSLDMLLKLVAVFGPTIRATVSAPPSVGDLVLIFIESKVKTIKRFLWPCRRGALAKSALELNLVL